jgi:hypothetical protein
MCAAGVPQTGLEVLGAATAWSVVLLATEFALLLALSPELAVAVERTRRSTPCELRDVPLVETHATLRSSRVWRDYEGRLTSAEPSEVWRELLPSLSGVSRPDRRPAGRGGVRRSDQRAAGRSARRRRLGLRRRTAG